MWKSIFQGTDYTVTLSDGCHLKFTLQLISQRENTHIHLSTRCRVHKSVILPKDNNNLQHCRMLLFKFLLYYIKKSTFWAEIGSSSCTDDSKFPIQSTDKTLSNPAVEIQGFRGDSRWGRARGWRCVAGQTAASSSGRAAQQVAGRANRSWPAGSETLSTNLSNFCMNTGDMSYTGRQNV